MFPKSIGNLPLASQPHSSAKPHIQEYFKWTAQFDLYGLNLKQQQQNWMGRERMDLGRIENDKIQMNNIYIIYNIYNMHIYVFAVRHSHVLYVSVPV